MTLALRTALIWHDEVMDDVVLERPRSITLGDSGKTTFVIPKLGLPDNFAVVRPGNRGYLLTLGERMRGTLCLDGEQKTVEEFVRRGGEGDGPGGFRATPISGKDWGVVELDESGAYKLFFQFVPLDEAPQFFTRPVMYAGVGGYLLAGLLLTIMWALKGHELDEAAFRGFGISTASLFTSGLGWWLMRQDGESQASFAFSVLLHTALLLMTYQLYSGEDPFVWPGPRSLTGNYLVTRLDPEVPIEPKIPPTVGKLSTEPAAAENPDKSNHNATKGDTGTAGGHGEKERASDPDTKDKVGKPPEVALMTKSNRKVIDDLIDAPVDLGAFNNLGYKKSGTLGSGEGQGTGFGPGTGTGTTRGGKGKGPGGGGNVEGDFQTKAGPIDTGKERPGGKCVGPDCTGAGPKQVALKLEDATGDFNGLSKDEIDRVVKARAGVFRACYQKELNRAPGLGGKLIIHFVIASDGTVKSSATQGGSLRNEGVESCVKNNIMRLKFPAKGGAIVNYPFVFTQGG